MADLNKIIDDLSSLTVVEAAELSKQLEEKWGVTAAAVAVPAAVIETVENLPLFEITELNGIDDRMTRGMAKKIFTAGKRAEKTRMEVILEIREALNSSGKLDESTATVLTKLESGN